MVMKAALAAGSLLYSWRANCALQDCLDGLSPPPYTTAPRYRVSVVTPAYNEEKYITKLLISVLNQTEPVAEHIVADSSEDGTAELARSWGAVVVTAEPGSISDSRNRGARAATGDVLLFCDADVLLSHRVVEAMVDALEAGAVLAHHKAATMYDSWFYNYAIWLPQLFRQPWDTGGCCIAIWAEAFWQMGAFDVACELGKCHEGKELGNRVAAAYGPGSVQTVWVPIAISARRYKRFGFLLDISTMETPVRARRSTW